MLDNVVQNANAITCVQCYEICMQKMPFLQIIISLFNVDNFWMTRFSVPTFLFFAFFLWTHLAFTFKDFSLTGKFLKRFLHLYTFLNNKDHKKVNACVLFVCLSCLLCLNFCSQWLQAAKFWIWSIISHHCFPSFIHATPIYICTSSMLQGQLRELISNILVQNNL